MPKDKKKASTGSKPEGKKKDAGKKKAFVAQALVEALPQGEAPSVRLDAATGTLVLGIPAGQKGDKGERGPAGRRETAGQKESPAPPGRRDRWDPRGRRGRVVKQVHAAKQGRPVHGGNSGSGCATREAETASRCATCWSQQMEHSATS